MVELAAAIQALRPADADYLILSVGAHGPNIDMPEGNMVATVRMGADEATAEAKYLPDAISLAALRSCVIVKPRGQRQRRPRSNDRRRHSPQPAPYAQRNALAPHDQG